MTLPAPPVLPAVWSRSARAAAAAIAVSLTASAGLESRPAQASPQTPTFRSAVDLISVDVQVVDREGLPVGGLGAEQFEVTINGRRRRVVSADFVDYRQEFGVPSAPPAQAPAIATPTTERGAQFRRRFILAVDSSSFDNLTGRPVLEAAAEFVRSLADDDEVGLFVFPVGSSLSATTDHNAVIRELGRISAHRDEPRSGFFGLSPSDLVELSTAWGGMGASRTATALQAKLCGSDDSCLDHLRGEVLGLSFYYEGLGETATGMLHSLMLDLKKVPNRKTVVLVSGGLVSADMPGARPNHSDRGLLIGRAAAEANVNVYTLFLDQSRVDIGLAETRRGRNSLVDISRDRHLNSMWLDKYSGAAGGSLIPISQGNGAAAFNRVLRETSAYYLLGVEPAAEDRDGRAHELRVRVRARDVGIRGRSWVLIPKPGSVSTLVASAPAPPKPAPAVPIRDARPVSPEVRALAEAIEKDDTAALGTALTGPNAVGLMRAVRASGMPWPESPKRSAAFALEVAFTALRSTSGLIRDDAVRLLVEYNVRIRQPDAEDPFECAWLRAETAGLQGLYTPGMASLLIERATERCPADPKLRLGLAVVRDQQLHQRVQEAAASAPSGPAPAIDREEARRVLALYEAAAVFPESKPEARIRAAWLSQRLGEASAGLALLDSLADPPAAPYVRYLGELIRGEILRSLGRSDDAIAAYRAALRTWAGAQSAQVGLMTLLVARGALEEAGAIANAVGTPSSQPPDPWWFYWLGAVREYPDLAATVKDLAR